MKTITNKRIAVAAPRDTVRCFASDPLLLAEWNNEYISRAPHAVRGQAEAVEFRCTARRGGPATWKLTLKERHGGAITEVKAELEEKTGFVRHPYRWLRMRSETWREAKLMQSLVRMRGLAESAARNDGSGLKPGDMVALLNVYTSQFGSYTTLLWQVPALGLTAQAFLMTIVLGSGSSISDDARYIAAALSAIVAVAAVRLMHDQRARAINHAELAKRISYKLSVTNLLGGSFGLDDAVPDKGTDAQNVWTTNRIIYGAWVICMCLFAVADAIVVISLLSGASWFGTS